MRLTEIEVDLKLAKFKFKVDEIEQTFDSLLDEMQSITKGLGPDEREKLRRIMSQESGSFLVTDVFPDFRRGSAAHDTLRRLRDAQFIRPVEGGPWQADSHVG